MLSCSRLRCWFLVTVTYAVTAGVTARDGLVNVALEKPTKMIDIKQNSPVYVDGKVTPMIECQACSVTNSDTDAWWGVDLQDQYNVYSINMVNCASHSSSGQMRDFHVYVSEIDPYPLPPQDRSSFPGRKCLHHEGVLSGSELENFLCRGYPNPLRGRYVYVWKPGNTGMLCLCELQVMADPEPDPLIPEGRAGHFSYRVLHEGQTLMLPLAAISLRLEQGTLAYCAVSCLTKHHETSGSISIHTMQYHEQTSQCWCFVSAVVARVVVKNMQRASGYNLLVPQIK